MAFNKLKAADQATIDASITRSFAVNVWLEKLKTTDAARFESVRRLTFEEIAAMAGL